MGKFFISCDEATTICDKNQYGEASFLDKIKLTMHFIRCKICKCYSSQNNIMTKILGNHSEGKCKKEKCLSDEEKENLKKIVKERML